MGNPAMLFCIPCLMGFFWCVVFWLSNVSISSIISYIKAVCLYTPNSSIYILIIVSCFELCFMYYALVRYWLCAFTTQIMITLWYDHNDENKNKFRISYTSLRNENISIKRNHILYYILVVSDGPILLLNFNMTIK